MLYFSSFVLLLSLVSAAPCRSSPEKAHGRADTKLVEFELAKLTSKTATARKAYSINSQHPDFAYRFKTIQSQAERLSRRNLRRGLEKRADAGYADLLDSFEGTDTPLDVSYTASVSVGTPPQQLLLKIDTGSSDLLVFSQDADVNGTGFVSDTSTSYVALDDNSYNETYFDGLNAFGIAAQDEVVFAGLDAGLQNLAVATYVTPGAGTPQVTYDGVIGLAFSSVSTSYPALNVFETLILNNVVVAPYFALYLSRASTVSDDSAADLAAVNGSYISGSQIKLGSLPELATNGSNVTLQYNYFPVTLPALWQVNMSSVTVGNMVVPNTSVEAVFDSGSEVITLPVAVADSLFSALGGIKLTDGTYAVSNEILQANSIGFAFNGTTYPVNPEDLILGYTGDATPLAITSIIGADIVGPDGETLIAHLGVPFLKNVVTVFSYAGGAGEADFSLTGPSVGLASLSAETLYSVVGNPSVTTERDNFTDVSGIIQATATLASINPSTIVTSLVPTSSVAI